MARRKNPGGGTLLLIGLGAAALGGVGYALHRSTRPKKKLRCPPGQKLMTRFSSAPGDTLAHGVEVCLPIDADAVEEATVKGVTNRPGKHVGAPSYRDWPFKSRYPNEAAFVAQFKALGYNPSDWLTDARGREAVREFQRDYNTISAKVAEWMWPITGHEPDAGLGRVTVDGWVGDQTINALVVASQAAERAGMRWRELVELKPDDEDAVIIIGDETIEEEMPMLGEGDDSDEIFFPPPPQGLTSTCLSKISAAVQEYAADGGDAQVMVEFVLDSCNAQTNAALGTAILTYIYEIGLANSLDSVSEYAGTLLA